MSKIVKKFGPIWVPSMDKTIGMTGVANQVSKRGSVRVGAWWYEAMSVEHVYEAVWWRRHRLSDT
jgi:hypothetical protein